MSLIGTPARAGLNHPGCVRRSTCVKHTDPHKESVTDPFLTPPEAFEKDQPDLYQPASSS